MRHAATRAVLERDDVIIVASVSCIYGIGSVETYTAMTFSLKSATRSTSARSSPTSSRSDTRARPADFGRGLFRVRGDTIELFPAHYEDRAWRIGFFGDEIEAIAEFDPLTGQIAGPRIRQDLRQSATTSRRARRCCSRSRG